MMTKEQFEVLKKKGGGDKLTLKEDDDLHGTIDNQDVLVDYFYNESEGRLNFSVSKRHTLAAYVASDNIIGTYLMDIFSAIPNPAPKSKSGGTSSDSGGSESTEKKDQ